MHLLGLWKWTPPIGLPQPTVAENDLKVFSGQKVERLEDDRSVILYDGTVFDKSRQDLLSDEQAFEDAFGTFSYVRIDKHSGAVTIGTDRLGFGPLYWTEQGDGFAFSSSLTRLKYLLPRATPNFDAWQEMLVLETALGSNTTIRQINRLETGCRLRLRAGKLRVERFWIPKPTEPMDIEEYCRSNNELLAASMKLAAERPEPKIILLSGGLDSRRLAIMAESIRLGHSFATQEAIHKGDVENDVCLAQTVARMTGVPLTCVPMPELREWFNDGLMRDYWLGFETSQHEWIFPLLRALEGKSLIFDGLLGGVVLNGAYFRSNPSWTTHWNNPGALASAICSTAHDIPFDDRLVSTPLSERLESVLCAIPPSPHRATWWAIINRQRRNTALQSWLYALHGHRTCFPFTYYKLLVQSLSIDPKQYLGRLLQRACAERLNPGLAALPSTRELLSGKFVRSVADVQAQRERFSAQRASVRRDAFEPFPGLRLRVQTHRFGHFLGLRPISARYAWCARLVRRYSRFLDWLDDTSMPPLDCRPDEPEFIRNRSINMSP
jgi:hypothetical protein